mgnify:CR=1 FL=1
MKYLNRIRRPNDIKKVPPKAYDALAEEILKKNVKPGDTVSVGFKNEKVTFTVKK